MFKINKFVPMSGFKWRTSGMGSNCSTNWATTTAPIISYGLILNASFPFLTHPKPTKTKFPTRVVLQLGAFHLSAFSVQYNFEQYFCFWNVDTFCRCLHSKEVDEDAEGEGEEDLPKLLLGGRPFVQIQRCLCANAKFADSSLIQSSQIRTKFSHFAAKRTSTSTYADWAKVWPDWAIYWTLGNFSKPLATINLPKSLTFLGNFCKGIKIHHFSSEIIFGQVL